MSDAPTTTPTADHIGPPWASDHPGRKCSQCKLTIYPLWIDSVPPPGTCPENAGTPAECRHNLDVGISGMAFALSGITGQPDHHAKMREILTGRGLDPDLIELFARDRLAIDKGRLFYGTDAIRVQGIELGEFLSADAGPALVRAIQIVDALCHHLQFATYIEDLRGDALDLWRRRFREALRFETLELLTSDPDDDAAYGDDEGEG